MSWLTVDTRNLDSIQSLVDGFVHVLPRSMAHKHWMEITCWCEPVAMWHPQLGTMVIYHRKGGQTIQWD